MRCQTLPYQDFDLSVWIILHYIKASVGPSSVAKMRAFDKRFPYFFEVNTYDDSTNDKQYYSSLMGSRQLCQILQVNVVYMGSKYIFSTSRKIADPKNCVGRVLKHP